MDRTPHFMKYVDNCTIFDFNKYTATQLMEDVVEICVMLNPKEWRASYADILKSLRASRWKPYTLRSKREWRIPVEVEEDLFSALVSWGFELGKEKGWKTNPKKRFLKPTPQLGPPKKEIVEAAAKRKPLEIELDVSVDELKEMLAGEKDQVRKKVIRAKLRRMGHKGGLRGDRQSTADLKREMAEAAEANPDLHKKRRSSR